jgi:hypothetical protein
MPLCPQITITPVTVTTTGMTQTSIIPIVAATTEETDELQVEIDSIEASVNGKNHIYRQASAPDGSVFPLTEGDVWFDTDDGNKQYYWTGTAWVSVQDLGIAAAESAAAAAVSAAAAASAAATAAQTTADGKNKVYRQATAPTGTHTIGDLWFNSSATNQPNRWTGSAWEAYGFGNLAVGNLDAAAISTGTLNADRIAAASITGAKLVAGTIEAVSIAAGTITGAKIAAGTIVASNIATGTITADQIAASTITAAKISSRTITADKIALFTLTADEIAGGTITAAEIAAGTITAAEIEAGSITVDRLTAGTLTAFTLRTSSGARRVVVSASTNSISFVESSSTVGHIGPASINGIVMHYGSTFNPAVTTFPHVYVTASTAHMAQSATRYFEVTSLGAIASGNFYSLNSTFIQDSSTTANASNARIDVGDGRLRRSTASSARFKDEIADISTVAELDPNKLLNLPVRAFKFKADYLDSTDNRAGMAVPGLIAEEVAEHYPIAADSSGGVVENWNERFIIPGMLALIQGLHARVESLESK